MNLAILDVGSNNIKLEIHTIDNDGINNLIYSDKAPARLGHNVFVTNKLALESENLAIEALKQFAKIIKSNNCKKTLAFGTAALRETDSSDFVKKIYKATGIQIQVISGLEEARLVYLGALSRVAFNGETFLLIDIGGGSTEVSVSNEKEILFSESLRLGTVRLKELFDTQNDKKSVRLTENYIRKVLHPFATEIKKITFERGLLTGGTAKNLSQMIKESYQLESESGGNPLLYTDDLKRLVHDMKQMKPKEVQKMLGLDKARGDIIFPGAILLLTLLEELKIKESVVSSQGLRDGMVTDYISKKVNKSIHQERQKEVRRFGLQEAAKKYNDDFKHAVHCANLALQLFELFKNEHELDDSWLDIIYGAALLHDSGIYIDYSQHHKHSQYLILNSNLPGFSHQEIVYMGLIARYHRKSLPKKSHLDYQELNPDEQKSIDLLSALLRLADALDRSYTSKVNTIERIDINDKQCQLSLQGKKDLSLEIWSFNRKKDFFEKAFKIKISIEEVTA